MPAQDYLPEVTVDDLLRMLGEGAVAQARLRAVIAKLTAHIADLEQA